MLSIGKLGRGAEGYELPPVAKGVEDYYLGSGEALGQWVESGSARLGLAGVVEVRICGLCSTVGGRSDEGRFTRLDRSP